MPPLVCLVHLVEASKWTSFSICCLRTVSVDASLFRRTMTPLQRLGVAAFSLLSWAVPAVARTSATSRASDATIESLFIVSLRTRLMARGSSPHLHFGVLRFLAGTLYTELSQE